MTKYETPRDGSGNRLCQYCHEKTVRQSLGTKPVIYCSAACKQRAYEARKTEKAIRAAVAAAERRAAAAAAKSQTLDAERRPDSRAKSVTLQGNVTDFAGGSSQVGEQTSLTLPLPDMGRLPAPAAEPEPAAAPRPRAGQGRRRAGMTASAIPLPQDWDEADSSAARSGWLRAVDQVAAERRPQAGPEAGSGGEPPTRGV
ncbi:hypothetical protein ACFV2Q_38435 [Streptomyces sp. NPDC059650]|uniref:hypothetical protein n=1 Tax=Streptomyces sp. NPDC059650 TaxID=3346896 RepID=UPI0036AF4665